MGLGTDIVRALCTYGFAVRGLHRLQIENAVDNSAMISAAERAGFTVEGTLRGSAWDTAPSPTRSSWECWTTSGATGASRPGSDRAGVSVMTLRNRGTRLADESGRGPQRGCQRSCPPTVRHDGGEDHAARAAGAVGRRWNAP
ncbi:GNAT family N-acetyltransferase [Streptomyces sp. NPDC007905]|uniref:GNAT family N-acetyltransferase n=1 Tax=Streptomyces sp. NPDC007905 TaxID=3364788 RepID=UPI0036E4A24D